MTLEKPALARGQAWSFAGAPDARSRVIIGRLETYASAEVAHVAFVDLPAPAGDKRVSVPHMPVARKVVEASLLRLHGLVEPPMAFHVAYAAWCDKVRAGCRTGVFTLPLGEALTLVYEASTGGSPRL